MLQQGSPRMAAYVVLSVSIALHSIQGSQGSVSVGSIGIAARDRPERDFDSSNRPRPALPDRRDSSSEIPDKVDAASQSYYSYQATTVEPFQDESSFPNKAGASPLVLSESRSNTRQFTSRPTAFFTPKSEWKETTNSDPFGTTPRYRDIAEDRPRYAKDPAYQDLPWPAVVVNRHTTKPKQRPTQRRQATYPAYAETSNPFNNRK